MFSWSGREITVDVFERHTINPGRLEDIGHEVGPTHAWVVVKLGAVLVLVMIHETEPVSSASSPDTTLALLDIGPRTGLDKRPAALVDGVGVTTFCKVESITTSSVGNVRLVCAMFVSRMILCGRPRLCHRPSTSQALDMVSFLSAADMSRDSR